MASQNHVKYELLERLKTHGNLSDKTIEEVKYCLVASDYFCLDDHREGPIGYGQKHYRQDGSEHTLEDVPLKNIVENIGSWIEKDIPEDRRIDVFEKVMAGLPGRKKTPKWTRRAVNPHEKPSTPFSVSRAAPRAVKSNTKLIETLVSVAGLKEEADNIRAQIIYLDAIGDDRRKPELCYGENPSVRGGRLGRDHTLEDVPNHYVRDRLMDYIDTKLEGNKQERARKAVFPDLNADERIDYSILIMRQRNYEKALKDMEVEMRYITGSRRSQSERETIYLSHQIAAFGEIDENISLKHRPGSGHNSNEIMSGSVIRPGLAPFPSETKLDLGRDIDWDCDQIRAMIKLFTFPGEWTVDDFRLALSRSITRSQLTVFLEKQGPKGGSNLLVYQLAWKFFKTRELLEIPYYDRLGGALEGAGRNSQPKQAKAKEDSKPTQHAMTTRSKARNAEAQT
ncbi:hypothetical protein AAE478_008943 [Parahypoxylon ruwenzoriense]